MSLYSDRVTKFFIVEVSYMFRELSIVNSLPKLIDSVSLQLHFHYSELQSLNTLEKAILAGSKIKDT